MRGVADLSRDRVNTYAAGHLMASHAGVAMFRAAASHHEGSPRGAELGALTVEIEADRASLEQIVRATGSDPGSVPHRAARYALEGLGHASRVLHWPTDLSTLAELEKLRGGVSAKAVGWEILLAAATHDHRLSRVELESLLARAHDQSRRLHTIHVQMAQVLFNSPDEGDEGDEATTLVD
jgi:hypothetical protein